MNNNSDTYRADIDGLRALAVMFVVLYHAGISVVSGGFIGVDVFFVISGFLITRLLLAEAERHGRINFYDFYLRRARRILPALFFTLAASLIVAFWLFTPLRLVSFGSALLHSVLSVSNISFFFASGYFDLDSSLNPLLHTWSLGVEEQFYLVWPIIISLIVITSRRKTLSKSILFVVIGLLSLVLSIALIEAYPSAVFYLMPFRVFEFVIGALLVPLMSWRLENNFLINGLSFLGLGLMGYAAFFFTQDTQFPALNALFPCVGAALCIYLSDRAFIGRILRSRLMVGIGLISYSLYLVHWVLIVFYKYHQKTTELVLAESIGLIITSLLLAILMYFLIEQPFRKPRKNNRPFLLLAAFFACSLSYAGASSWIDGGWAWRPWVSNTLSVEQISYGKNHRFIVRQRRCSVKGYSECDIPVDGKINALVIGDSHAVDALNAFDAIFPVHDLSLSESVGCPPHKNIEMLVPPTHPRLDKCIEINASRHNVEYLRQYDYIVINVLHGWYSDKHLLEYLHFLKSNALNRVIVFGNYYQMKEEMAELVNREGIIENYFELFAKPYVPNDSTIGKATNALGYFFISKQDAFCKKEKCLAFDVNNVPFSYDKHHLSFEFASKMALKEKENLIAYLALK